MSRSLIAAAVALLAPAALAQDPDGADTARVTVRLSSFEFTPAEIRLRAGRPVVLQLVNAGDRSHNFSAPEFFAAAAIREEDRGLVYKGAIELRGRQSKAIALVPRRGIYGLRCTHVTHGALGMKGYVVVD